MIATITIKGTAYTVNLGKPVDISIPFREGKNNVNAFHIPDVIIEPFRIGNFIGAVSEGGACNVNNISFNPHGNGTHTECAGHISKEKISINQSLKNYFFHAVLISIEPEIKSNGDLIITKTQIEKIITKKQYDALIIRTLPNDNSKLNRRYSDSNPPYMEVEAAEFLCKENINHLLLDVPSIDREEDGGKLSAHHAFWNYPTKTRTNSTITELIYVPEEVNDGEYLLTLNFPSFENDAAPSKPVLYAFI